MAYFGDRSWGIRNLEIEVFNICPEDCLRCHMDEGGLSVCIECEVASPVCVEQTPYQILDLDSSFNDWYKTDGSELQSNVCGTETLLIYDDKAMKKFELDDFYNFVQVSFTLYFFDYWEP